MVKIWPRLVAMMTQQGSSVAGALSLASLNRIEDNQAVVRFRYEGESFARMWEKNGKRDLMAKAISDIRGRPIGVRFEVEEASAAAAARRRPAGHAGCGRGIERVGETIDADYG